MDVVATREFTFDSAYHLPEYPGRCKDLHGRTYKLEVSVEDPLDPVTHMAVDFGMLKAEVNNHNFCGERDLPVRRSGTAGVRKTGLR